MKAIITGGAGFIGTNLTEKLAQRENEITIIDNLSRNGSPGNIRWLMRNYNVEFKKIDYTEVNEWKDSDVVFHLAGQVAVTESVKFPILDFNQNIRGTFLLLEALRELTNIPVFIFASTNKVYGTMPDKLGVFAEGVMESCPLEFCSPYGCSKGAADQYALDYSRIYGMPNVVFRQSCIYGPHQNGMEDQGWVAWFILRAMNGEPITIYGDGTQVRDVLYVDDLVSAYLLAYENIQNTRGKAYNIGGGLSNALSLNELICILQSYGCKFDIKYSDWRPGDQRRYVSKTTKAFKEFGWEPKISKADGIRMTYEWMRDNLED